MQRLTIAFALLGLLSLGACGKPDQADRKAENPPPAAERKCPDPSIKDSSDPCSPHYYKPVKGSFKGQKTF